MLGRPTVVKFGGMGRKPETLKIMVVAVDHRYLIYLVRISLAINQQPMIPIITQCLINMYNYFA